MSYHPAKLTEGEADKPCDFNRWNTPKTNDQFFPARAHWLCDLILPLLLLLYSPWVCRSPCALSLTRRRYMDGGQNICERANTSSFALSRL
jgi:hypothetical protein